MVIGTPQALTERSTDIDREFYDYYRTPRGHHPRSTTAMSVTTGAPMALFSAFEHLDWISPRPVLFVTGDRAHSRLFSEQAYERAAKRGDHPPPGTDRPPRGAPDSQLGSCAPRPPSDWLGPPRGWVTDTPPWEPD